MTRVEADRLLALARQANLSGPEAEAWTKRLEPERENLAEAARLLVREGDAESAAEMAANVWRLWLVTGDPAGGRELLAAALDAGPRAPSSARALALYGDGLLAFRARAQAESRRRNEEALEVARAVGDKRAESLALVGLSRVALRDGDYSRVRVLAALARELAREFGPAADAAPLHMLAAGTRLAGDYDDAVRLYSESLDLSRKLGNSRGVAMELHNIGHVELHRGRVGEAERCFSECAGVRDANDPYEAAMTHLNQAGLAFAHGERERAAALLQSVRTTLDAAKIVLDPDDAFEVQWLSDRLG
ncbi:MAG TPA: tetratricopeptide repeat protein [Candidatus Limnocylindrales bacterium]|nr:tetratricopeptide repeat protein [Candidatus Limnocylindrales bacterium]